MSGVAVAAALVAGGVGLLAGAGASAGGGAAVGTAAGAANATGMAVFLTGSLYVAEQAVSDAMSGRLSETEQYARKALAGSVVGFLTGASGLLMQGSGLGKVLAIGFGEGFLGSAATQALLNEDGEINWALAFGEGMFSAAVTGMAWEIGGSIKSIEGGSKGSIDSSTPKPNSGQGFSAKGYNPQPGERTFEGYMNKNVPQTPETKLYTNSSGFNTNPSEDMHFKRYGTKPNQHGIEGPHVHQPTRNINPYTGEITGKPGSKTKNGGVTIPGKKDIKQLYEYLENGKYN